MTNDMGAIPGSRASTEPCSTVSALTGFDPARKLPPLYVFPSQVAGALAMWAIRQSPFDCPANLQFVVQRFTQLFPKDGDETLRQLGMVKIADQDELYAAVMAVFEQIPELLAWNTPKSGGEGTRFVTRYSAPDPQNDFIDLYALANNVARTVASEEAEAAAMWEASAIEARSDATGTDAAEGESAGPKDDAQANADAPKG
jgi:hypothetical protein